MSPQLLAESVVGTPERKGKRRTAITTAIARELSAFIWAINCDLMAHREA
jgi:hypothetical protein